MNFELSDIPERPKKPRNSGLTMMMDKGLSIRQAEDFLSVSSNYCDLVKLGFGTSYIRYVPHRHAFVIWRSMSSSVGFGVFASSAAAARIIPD